MNTSTSTSNIQRRSSLATLGGAAVMPQLLTGAENAAPLRAGQIGTQHAHAAGKLEAMRYLSNEYTVVAMVENNEKALASAKKNKAYADLPWLEEAALLADASISIVAIETTLEEATATASRAIAAGKHIHLDKPGGSEHAAYRSMRLLAEKKGLQVQMGYMLRHNPAFTLLFRAAREGWLGDIQEITATMGKQANAGLRNSLATHPGHGMFELACHLVDAVVTLLGAPQQVHAFGVATKSPADTFIDNQLAVLEYPRALVTLRCNHDDPGGTARRAFTVVGSQGSIHIAPLESGEITLQLQKTCEMFTAGEHQLTLPLPRGRYDAEFLSLAKWIRGQEPSPWSAEHDVQVHATALRAAGLKAD